MATVDRPSVTEPGQRAADEPRADRSSRLAGVVGLITVVIVAGALAGPWDPPVRHGTVDRIHPSMPPVTPLEPIPVGSTELQPWDLTWLGASLGVVLMGWVLFLVLRWLKRHPAPTEPEGPDDGGIELDDAFAGPGTVVPNLPKLREGVAQAGDELRGLVRPCDAVIAAWVRLEAAAAHSGVVRDRASTPTEFTLEVLDAAPVDPQATRTLLDLYLRARFGGELMGPDDVASAITALALLALGLGESEDADTADWVIGDEPERPGDPDHPGESS
jgi:hypothetical protein